MESERYCKAITKELEGFGYMLTDAEKAQLSAQIEVQLWNSERERIERRVTIEAYQLLTHSGGAGKITMPIDGALIEISRK